MNILPIETVAIPDAPPGFAKTQTDGADSFSILMAAIAAGNLIQQVDNDAAVGKSAVPEPTGSTVFAPPTPQLSGQITEVNPPIVGSKAKGDGLTVTSQERDSQDLATLLNTGMATDPESIGKNVLEKGENPNLASLLSSGKTTDTGQIGKKGIEATLEVSTNEEAADAVPETPNPSAFLDNSSKGEEARKRVSGELKGMEFKPAQQDVKEIAYVKADAASEGIPVFNPHPPDQLATGVVAVDENSFQVRSRLPIEPAKLVEQVSDGVKSVIKAGSGEVRMELHPESLGHLRIEVKVEGGVVKANITAENVAVKDTIDSNLPMLRKSLEDQGLRIDQLSVGVDQRQGGNAFAERERFQMWQALNGAETQYRDEDISLNEPVYSIPMQRNEGVSIFA